jgi:hypothetical protein
MWDLPFYWAMHERFNRTVQDEFLALGNMAGGPLEDTFVRPHQSLGEDTPWQYDQQNAQVLPRYASRTMA